MDINKVPRQLNVHLALLMLLISFIVVKILFTRDIINGPTNEYNTFYSLIMLAL